MKWKSRHDNGTHFTPKPKHGKSKSSGSGSSRAYSQQMLNNGIIHDVTKEYVETRLPNGDILRRYWHGMVRIIDPVTGGIKRMTLGSEDPFKCRVCGNQLEDTDVVTVCEPCDRKDIEDMEIEQLQKLKARYE